MNPFLTEIMAETSELKYFNWLSIAFGIGLFIDKHKWIKLVNHTRALTVLVTHMYFMVNYILNFLDQSSNRKRRMNLGTCTYFLGVIIYTIFLNVSRREISSILLSCLKFMTIRDKSIMKWTSIALTIMILVHLFVYIISTVLLKYQLLKIKIIHTLVFNQTDIYMHGCSLCFIFILFSYFCHQNILRRINQKIRQSLDNNTIRKMVLSLLFIQLNMRRMNKVCGPVLLLQFSIIYTAIPNVVFSVTGKYGYSNWVVIEMTAIMAHIVIVFLMVTVVEKLTAKLQETRTEILVKMMGRKDIDHSYDMDTFMKLLQDKDLVKYTAMDMFDINYGMLLPFLGSVISLTVLICQLSDTKQ